MTLSFVGSFSSIYIPYVKAGWKYEIKSPSACLLQLAGTLASCEEAIPFHGTCLLAQMIVDPFGPLQHMYCIVARCFYLCCNDWLDPSCFLYVFVVHLVGTREVAFLLTYLQPPALHARPQDVARLTRIGHHLNQHHLISSVNCLRRCIGSLPYHVSRA
jgi:hypothetical protein